MTRVVLSGDSHGWALWTAVRNMREAGMLPVGLDVTVRPLGSSVLLKQAFYDRGPDGVAITEPTLAARVPSLPLPGETWEGTVFGWTGLHYFAGLWQSGDWRRFRRAGRAGAGMPVSTGMLRGIVRNAFRHQLGLLDALRADGCRVLVVESPRPFRHHPVFRAMPEEHVGELAALTREVIDAELAAREVPVVRIPDCCLDGSGFMLDDYRSDKADDFYHANGRFGEVMLAGIPAVLRQVGWERDVAGTGEPDAACS